MTQKEVTRVHEGKRPIFVYLCALLFEKRTRYFTQPGGMTQQKVTKVHEGKQPIFVYLCALLFKKEPATLLSQANDLTEGHEGTRRQAANLRLPLCPSVRKSTRHFSQPGGMTQQKVTKVHERKQPIFVYLCALLFKKEPATLLSQANDPTEGHEGARRQAANLRVPLRPSVRKKNLPLYSARGNDPTEGHEGTRRQAANLRVPLPPSVRKKNPPLYSASGETYVFSDS